MEKVKFSVNGISGEGISFEKDFQTLQEIYYKWKEINEVQESLGVRRVNIPESVGEGIPCYLLGILRTNNVQIKGLKHSSMDAVCPKTGSTYQIKACSTTKKNSDGSPSSFGPRSEWDKLIYAHFDCDNDIVKLYEFTEDIDSIKINRKGETFHDQCLQGRRPRFNLFPFLKNTKPIVTLSMKTGEIINA